MELTYKPKQHIILGALEKSAMLLHPLVHKGTAINGSEAREVLIEVNKALNELRKGLD